MVQKHMLIAARQRHIPTQFSWIDQRLVRDRFIDRCTADAWAVYLFLVAVADALGLSYYGDATLVRRLRLDAQRFVDARDELIALDLIAWQPPLYQVLSLPDHRPPPPPSQRPPEAHTQEGRDDRSGERHIAEILRSLAAQR